MYKIKVTEKIEGDLYAQFKGVYLNDEPKIAQSSKAHGGHHELQINKGQEIKLNFDAVGLEPKVGSTVSVNGVFSIYAQNLLMGGLLCVTKVTS